MSKSVSMKIVGCFFVLFTVSMHPGFCQKNSLTLGAGASISNSQVTQNNNCPKFQENNYYNYPLINTITLFSPLKSTILNLQQSHFLSDANKILLNSYYSYLTGIEKGIAPIDQTKLFEIISTILRLNNEEDEFRIDGIIRQDSLSNLYTYVQSLTCQNFELSKIDSVGYIRNNGDSLIKSNFQIFRFKGGYGKIKIGNKYGYINMNRQVVIKPYYDEADDFYDGYAIVKINDESNNDVCFVLNLITQKSYSFPQYSEIYPLQDGCARIRNRNGYYNYIDKDFNLLFEKSSIEIASDFNSHFAMITKKREYQKGVIPAYDYYYIDKKGTKVSRNYSYAGQFNEYGHAVVACIDSSHSPWSRYYLIDTTFKIISEPFESLPEQMNYDIFRIKGGFFYKEGLVLGTGFKFLDYKYKTIADFINGFAIVEYFNEEEDIYDPRVNSKKVNVPEPTTKYNLINRYGGELFPGKYFESISFLAQDLILLKEGKTVSKWKISKYGNSFCIENCN